MKRERELSEVSRNRPAEKRPTDQGCYEPCQQLASSSRSSETDRGRCHKTKACSVVIQRLSEATLRRFLRQGYVKAKKLSAKTARNVDCAPQAAGLDARDDSVITADSDYLRDDRTEQVSRKTTKTRSQHRASRDVRHCFYGRDSCSVLLQESDEVLNRRSEELADIINFLIETDPDGRKDDYIRDIEDSNAASFSSTQVLYGFTYDPAMPLFRQSDCESSRSDMHHPSQDSFAKSPPCGNGIAGLQESSRLRGYAMSPSNDPEENLLLPKETQSFESLISTSDSEGRLVIDEGDDVDPDNTVLAECYRESRNDESASESMLNKEAGSATVSDVLDEGSGLDISSRIVVENPDANRAPMCGWKALKYWNVHEDPL